MEYIPIISKIARFIGLTITLSFVIWGLSPILAYHESPFEAFSRNVLNLGYAGSEVAMYVIAGIVIISGWYYRFTIGATLLSLIFKAYDFIKYLLNKI